MLIYYKNGIKNNDFYVSSANLALRFVTLVTVVVERVFNCRSTFLEEGL